MESSFAGLDRGKHKGYHFTTTMLESLGVDLCRTILIYKNIYVPQDLSHLFIKNSPDAKQDPNEFSNQI